MKIILLAVIYSTSAFSMPFIPFNPAKFAVKKEVKRTPAKEYIGGKNKPFPKEIDKNLIKK